jgi:prophage antirepressor-like protein
MKIEVVNEKEFSHPTLNANLTGIVDDEGNRWFIAKEICDGLELQNVSYTVKTLRNEDKTSIVLPGENMKKTLVNKRGLFHLCLKSRKPKAEKFKEWVSGICDSLSEKGFYVANSKEDKMLLSCEKSSYNYHQLESEKMKPAVNMILTIQKNLENFKEVCISMIEDPPNSGEELRYQIEHLKAFDFFAGWAEEKEIYEKMEE